MKEKINFKEWLGMPAEEMFGFGKAITKKVPNFYEEQPIEQLSTSLILDKLTYMGPINNKKPLRLFDSVVDYGSNAEKMQVVISPYGSLKIIIRKVATTLEGSYVPLCYKIYPLINDYNHNVNDSNNIENVIANKVADFLIEIDNRNILGGLKDYDNLKELTLEMARQVRANHPKCMHFEGVVSKDEYNYTIYLQYNGQGGGAPGAKRAEQFDIHLNYNKDTGLIRCWGNEILSPTRQHLWYVQPSEWDEYFSPKQKNNEIVECIMNALYTY